jgi:hypothetical protein
LVRDRVKKILEMAVPGACKFYKAEDRKGKVKLDWWLAVPTTLIDTPRPKASAERCSKCGETKVTIGPLGDPWKAMHGYDSKGVDVFKSLGWHTHQTVEGFFEEFKKHYPKDEFPWKNYRVPPPPHRERWTRIMIARDLYFSVRLEQLLKRAKVKGQLIRSADFNGVKASAEDEKWIAEKLGLLAKAGLVEGGASAKGGVKAEGWFKDYLKQNAKGKPRVFDFAAIEKREKIKLPNDYKEFVRVVGAKSFPDVMEMEGFKATLVAPRDLNFKEYRRGKVEFLEGEDAEVDGVMFATTDHGDAFVFDVRAKGKDFPVYRHDHENNVLEQFAPNFASCVRRFVEKN